MMGYEVEAALAYPVLVAIAAGIRLWILRRG